jgi:hypothetical protein
MGLQQGEREREREREKEREKGVGRRKWADGVRCKQEN